jgi:acetoin utilization protein AcuB
MFVADWMTKKVFTVEPGESISDAARVLRDKGVKHLPVVKRDRVKGILSDRDIREYVPSKSTSLDVYELHYILQKTKVKAIMKTRVFTTTPDTPVEEASLVMLEENIGCLPVIEGGELVGIISDRDIFRVLVDVTGVRHGGHRISLTLPDTPGSIKEVADVVRKHGFSLQGVLTSYEHARKGTRNVVIRTGRSGDFNGMTKELEAAFRGVRVKKG